MSTDQELKQERQQRPVSELSLWMTLLGPPIVWALEWEVGYALVPFHCYSGTRLPIFLVTTGALLLTLAAGMLAFVNWQRVGQLSPNEGTGVESHIAFMSVLALMGSSLFSLVAIAATIAVAMFHPCWR